MRNYKTTTFEAVTNETGVLKFVRIAEKKHLEQLKPNEYFAVMVTDYSGNDSPHIKGVDIYTGDGLVGIECVSDNRNYISKDYFKRTGLGRGKTVIVKVSKQDLKKCCIL